MDRRFLLAVALMVVVLVGPSLLLKRPPARTAPPADTTTQRVQPSGPASAGPVAGAARPAHELAPPEQSFDTVSLALADATYRFTTRGAALEQATFPAFRSFHPGDGKRPAQLLRQGSRLLVSRLVVGGDTVRLDDVPFRIEQRRLVVRMTGRAGALAPEVSITPVAGHPYLLDVQGSVDGLEGRGALLLVGLDDGFANVEADSLDNYRNYAVAVRRVTPENTDFRSVDSGVVKTLDGPLDWVAVKSKYFMGALLSADSSQPQFGGAVLTGGPRVGRVATSMQTWVTMPVGLDGRFHYQLYLGPQTHQTLSPLGRQLDRATTYGAFLKGIVMPVAGWFTRLFIWMHDQFHMSYGLVLVVFGVLVRLLLWPLNQRAMKSQVAMMAVQPILKDLQTRHKNDPTKLQTEMMKVYKEHGVNPLGGCLPMLLPMPVLLALFFVFSRAIELRGTPFLWLPDLSLRDPYFITPLVMGGSMYVLSKLSQAGMPPNPQAKMMTVMMPIMMTVLFFNFASGLNLYYAVSNLVSLPQQYLINKARLAEMGRRQVAAPGKT
ncbi:MAG: YidC/Oxa1 family insertase periplasmic-domain containing protein [Gemmatimonadales bacterium]